jgi:Autophagocytosis associated protein, active-site domain
VFSRNTPCISVESDSDDSEFDSDSDDDIPDMESFVGTNVVQDDPSALAPSTTGSVSRVHKTRTYDVCIAFDQFYQTPVIWLTGYDEVSECVCVCMRERVEGVGVTDLLYLAIRREGKQVV